MARVRLLLVCVIGYSARHVHSKCGLYLARVRRKARRITLHWLHFTLPPRSLLYSTLPTAHARQPFPGARHMAPSQKRSVWLFTAR